MEIPFQLSICDINGYVANKNDLNLNIENTKEEKVPKIWTLWGIDPQSWTPLKEL